MEVRSGYFGARERCLLDGVSSDGADSRLHAVDVDRKVGFPGL